MCERVCRVVSPSLTHTPFVPLAPASQIALWVRCFFHQGWRWPKHMGRNSATLRLRFTWQTPAGTPVQLFVRVNASLLPLCYSSSKRDFKFLSLQKQRDRTSRLSSPPPPPCVGLTLYLFYFFHSAACRAAFRSICIDHGVLNRIEI